MSQPARVTDLVTQMLASQYNNLLDVAIRNALNYVITPTVASNNLTVALKNLEAADATANDPFWFNIGNSWRSISAALSVTINAAANTFNAGSSELAAKEIDYFVYLGWRAASSTVFIGISRIPSANLYSDFSSTATNEKYLAYSGSAPASTDVVTVIGRFAATLSAGAGYTWTSTSQSAPTTANTIQRPVYETRWLSWQPTYGGSGSLTYTTVTTTLAKYKIVNDIARLKLVTNGTTGGVTSTTLTATTPWTCVDNQEVGPAVVLDGAGGINGQVQINAAALSMQRYDGGNWGLGAGRQIRGKIDYQI